MASIATVGTRYNPYCLASGKCPTQLLYGTVDDVLLIDILPVKSGSTPVRGPVKSGRKRTEDKGRGLDKRLVWPELVTAWIQRLRTMSVDPLRRFWSRRGDGDRDGDRQDQE